VTPSPVRNMNVTPSPVRNMNVTPSPVRNMNVTPSPVRNMNVTPSPVRNMTPSPVRSMNITPSPVRSMNRTQSTVSSMSNARLSPITSQNIKNTETIQPIKIIPIIANEIIPAPIDMEQLTSKPIVYQQMTPSTYKQDNNFTNETTKNAVTNRGIVDRKPNLGKNICK
jgi:hypothetical protein